MSERLFPDDQTVDLLKMAERVDGKVRANQPIPERCPGDPELHVSPKLILQRNKPDLQPIIDIRKP